MSTSLVLGNGSTLVNIDDTLNIKDYYWPFVGEANHLSQKANEIFFVIGQQRFYLSHQYFEFSYKYLENSLVSVSTATSSDLQLEITFHDFVVNDKDIFIRRIGVKNLSPEYREITMFFKHNYYMREDDIGNTATWYEPAKLMCHYKKNTYLGVGITSDIYQYTCASPTDNNNQGAVPDQYGELYFNPVSTGTTESCISYQLKLSSQETENLDYFIVCGQNYQDITELANFTRKTDLAELMEKTNFYWQNWIIPRTGINFFDNDDQNKTLEELYARSLLIMRTQTDNHGAIIAANDSEFVKQGGKDSYSYMWPRDGANTAIAFIEAGYPELAKNFFRFCAQVITKEGFLHHKYYSDMSKGIGSSWHPWIDKYGNQQYPIQEDETAIVIVALFKYYTHYEDLDLITELWDTFIVPALNFLIDYRYLSNSLEDNNPIGFKLAGSLLPKPSYDIWEIHWGVHSYTVATVYAALMAGAKLAESRKVEHLIDQCLKSAEDVKSAYEEFFFDNDRGVFINSIYWDNTDTKCRKDLLPDSSISALWSFGMFDITDERIKKTIETIEKALWIDTAIGGLARKADDRYLQIDRQLPGNPWFISTLWMAQYWLKVGDKDKANKYLTWVLNHVDHTGLIAEQAHPYNGYSMSMKPLTWSHAEFVRTVNMIGRKRPAEQDKDTTEGVTESNSQV